MNLFHYDEVQNKNTSIILSAAFRFVGRDECNLFSFCSPLLEYLNEVNIEAVIVSGAQAEPLVAYSKIFSISKVL